MEAQNLQPISSPTAIKIVDAASHLFMQKGYKAVSINDIIRAAEVTKPTLYYYFADKEELFVQMGLRVLVEMGDRLDRAIRVEGEIVVRLTAVASALMANRDADMRMMRHEMFEHLNATNRQRLAHAFFTRLAAPVLGVMQRGIAEGELGHYSAPTLAKIFISMAEALQEPDLPTGEDLPPESGHWSTDERIGSAAMVQLFLRGVAA